MEAWKLSPALFANSYKTKTPTTHTTQHNSLKTKSKQPQLSKNNNNNCSVSERERERDKGEAGGRDPAKFVGFRPFLTSELREIVHSGV